MAQKSILLDKSLLFAARIVNLNKYLIKEKKKTNNQKSREPLILSGFSVFFVLLINLCRYICRIKIKNLLQIFIKLSTLKTELVIQYALQTGCFFFVSKVRKYSFE